MSEEKLKKGNFLTDYLRDAVRELRKVTWPSRLETWRKSWIVIGFSVGFTIFLGAMDYGLNILLEFIL